MTRYADTIGPKRPKDSIRGADAFLSKYNDNHDEQGRFAAGASPYTDAHAAEFKNSAVAMCRSSLAWPSEHDRGVPFNDPLRHGRQKWAREAAVEAHVRGHETGSTFRGSAITK